MPPSPAPAAVWSIPACAGEPQHNTARSSRQWVYPRVCGGTFRRRAGGQDVGGLSPRVRGNLAGVVNALQSGRSIPACAGEPPLADKSPRTARVYPRVCGGTCHTLSRPSQRRGLSPRVRGNRLPPLSITATVYPRVCGGTCWKAALRSRMMGLSPRVRGNPERVSQRNPAFGSIPACAGEPRRTELVLEPAKVYPRVCGGTLYQLGRGNASRGLSPRVRGNRIPKPQRSNIAGSIPACAGEPPRRSVRPAGASVYPRVCGGTARSNSPTWKAPGLSPRVRGNLSPGGRGGSGRGSIPACAGEPYAHRPPAPPTRVYPRVCGGTTADSGHPVTGLGLSPRVRGNLLPPLRIPPPERSIPACAGEPRPVTGWCWVAMVYPRVCGGTVPLRLRRRPPQGLSPRVRGNR